MLDKKIGLSSIATLAAARRSRAQWGRRCMPPCSTKASITVPCAPCTGCWKKKESPANGVIRANAGAGGD